MINYDNLNDFGEFQVKRSILMKHPNVEIHSNLFDGHIYICKRHVLSLLVGISQTEKIENFKDDFIPFLLEFQNNKELGELLRKEERGQVSQNIARIFGLEKTERFRVHAYIQSQIYARRINNIKDYQQANLDSLLKDDKAISCFQGTLNNDDSMPDDRFKTSLVGELSDVSDKAQITRSIIGKQCIIKENVKIINSIVMHQTTINEK